MLSRCFRISLSKIEGKINVLILSVSGCKALFASNRRYGTILEFG